MKVTIEMDYAEFNEYQSMKDKVCDPNYVDVTQEPIQDILIKKGFKKVLHIPLIKMILIENWLKQYHIRSVLTLTLNVK